jgi:hypothetical protein
MSLIFMDCEAYGGCPAVGRLTEFGAVDYATRWTFHGIILASRPSEANPAVPESVFPVLTDKYGLQDGSVARERAVFADFAEWLKKVSPKEAPVFVSDNPAFDWQWINDGFWRTLNLNPFGHSARRISDFYAGLCGDFRRSQQWKRLRITKHDHNPVNDAMGNVEAFERLLKGER